MSTKPIIAAAIAALAFSFAAKAQTNVQTFYDFGKDRKYVTTTFEMFKGDKFGDTFFFIDHYTTQLTRISRVFRTAVPPTAATSRSSAESISGRTATLRTSASTSSMTV